MLKRGNSKGTKENVKYRNWKMIKFYSEKDPKMYCLNPECKSYILEHVTKVLKNLPMMWKWSYSKGTKENEKHRKKI